MVRRVSHARGSFPGLTSGGTTMRQITLGIFLIAAWLLTSGVGTASASHTCGGGAAVCGQNSGLVPFHKDAVQASLIWQKHEHGSDRAHCPKMIIWMRPSEYKPKDYLNPTVGGVFSGFNLKYLELVQGGFNLGMLDRSGWSRYAPDLERENAQVVDVCGLQALIDSDTFTKTNVADLTDADISPTDQFFQDAGFSRGLSYNLFCMGQETGVDGRLYVFGLHDKGGNNGGRKVNIFDPGAEKWVWRGTTCIRAGWEADPTGSTTAHCDPLNEDNTDPPLPSDMKYQRWYPSTVSLPDGRILILSGTDQDTSVGNALASATKVRQAVPEVYDPKADKTVALENARKLLPMFPRAFVVQTGPGKKDWKVAPGIDLGQDRHFPILLSWARLDDEGSGKHREELSCVFQRHRLIRLGIVNLRYGPAELLDFIRVRGAAGALAGVRVRPGEDQDPAVRKGDGGDRKSTRLNSSHLVISYAVFCLKKK